MPTTLFATEVPTFWNDNQLTALLRSKGIQVNAQSTTQSTSLLASVLLGFGPTLLIVGLFVLFARRAAWLYRIAFNEAQRRLGKHEPATVAPKPDGEDPAAAISDTPTRGPAAKALEREFEAILEYALKQLPPEWRAAVVLRDLEGLSTKDAAMVVGIRGAAFKSRLHRGRMQLRGLLEPSLGLEEE